MEIKATLEKPYTEDERINFIVENNHKLGYLITETAEELQAWGADESDLLQQAKESKIKENDSKRDEALNQGVIYKQVLFDSDTDQKVNLLATVSMMNDEDKIEWFGMDNVSLLCDREDLINIGGLITQLHSFCWNKNAEIKNLINNATTIEEVEEIDTNYILPITETESEEENEI